MTNRTRYTAFVLFLPLLLLTAWVDAMTTA